jgi:hypothetical protein
MNVSNWIEENPIKTTIITVVIGLAISIPLNLWANSHIINTILLASVIFTSLMSFFGWNNLRQARNEKIEQHRKDLVKHSYYVRLKRRRDEVDSMGTSENLGENLKNRIISDINTVFKFRGHVFTDVYKHLLEEIEATNENANIVENIDAILEGIKNDKI